MADNIVLVRESDQPRIVVKIGAGHSLVQLPTGFAYDDGDEVALTIPQFDQLDIRHFHGDAPVLINNGPADNVVYDGEFLVLYAVDEVEIEAEGGGEPEDEVDLDDDINFTTFSLDYELTATVDTPGTGDETENVTDTAKWTVDGGDSVGVAIVTVDEGVASVSWTTDPELGDAFELTAVWGTHSDSLTISVVDTG